jgi:predicted DNA-binding transcriptional regulator YafY
MPPILPAIAPRRGDTTFGALHAAKGPTHEIVERIVPFDQLDEAYRELLTFGGDVEVREPPA